MKDNCSVLDICHHNEASLFFVTHAEWWSRESSWQMQCQLIVAYYRDATMPRAAHRSRLVPRSSCLSSPAQWKSGPRGPGPRSLDSYVCVLFRSRLGLGSLDYHAGTSEEPHSALRAEQGLGKRHITWGKSWKCHQPHHVLLPLCPLL